MRAGLAQQNGSTYAVDRYSVVGAAISRPLNMKLHPTGRLIAAPTGVEVFERHARVGVPYERFVGSAFTAVGRNDLGASFFHCARSAHHTCSLFTIHFSLFTKTNSNRQLSEKSYQSPIKMCNAHLIAIP